LRPLLFACLLAFAAIPILAPRAAEVTGDPGAFDELIKTGFENATFYRATRPDPRLCPASVCGGFFVERVNRKRTLCADGSTGEECHAAMVDLSRLGLDAATEAKLLADFGAGLALARGSLVQEDFGGSPVPTLVVDQAWRGVTGTRADRGRWFGLRSSGIACITHPCPELVRVKLNSLQRRFLHVLDLSTASDATSSEISYGLDSLYQGPGLIAYGETHRITGPAGSGRELVASEFYTKVGEGRPMTCGGFGYPPKPACADGEFCERPPDTCLLADGPGECQPIPEACPAVFDPVCGCDGVTYGNDCARQMAGVGLDLEGACSPAQECGWKTCAPGTICCNPLLGICAPSGWACTQ